MLKVFSMLINYYNIYRRKLNTKIEDLDVGSILFVNCSTPRLMARFITIYDKAIDDSQSQRKNPKIYYDINFISL